MHSLGVIGSVVSEKNVFRLSFPIHVGTILNKLLYKEDISVLSNGFGEV